MAFWFELLPLLGRGKVVDVNQGLLDSIDWNVTLKQTMKFLVEIILEDKILHHRTSNIIHPNIFCIFRYLFCFLKLNDYRKKK